MELKISNLSPEMVTRMKTSIAEYENIKRSIHKAQNARNSLSKDAKISVLTRDYNVMDPDAILNSEVADAITRYIIRLEKSLTEIEV